MRVYTPEGLVDAERAERHHRSASHSWVVLKKMLTLTLTLCDRLNLLLI